MKNIATIDDIINGLASRQGLTPEYAKELVLNYFKVIQEVLIDDDNVTISGFGSFFKDKATSIAFSIDKEAGEKLNEPFSMFDDIVLDSDFNIAELNADNGSEPVSNIQSQSVDNQPYPPTSSDNIETANIDSHQGIEGPVEELVESETKDEIVNEDTPIESNSSESEDIIEEDEEEIDSTENEYTDSIPYQKKCRRLLFFLLGFVAGAICSVITFALISGNIFESGESDSINKTNNPEFIESPSNSPSVSENINDNEYVINSISNVEISEPIIELTDTVHPGYYLASMARKHFGKTEFWVYIYEENKSIISNPDRVEVNTILIIPPAAKYDIDKDSPESIKRAKALASNIYSKKK